MTEEEITNHRQLVNNGKAKEFYYVSYFLEILGSKTKIKSFCYFRSNIPISFAEDIIRKQSKGVKIKKGENLIANYKKDSIKLLSYEDKIPKVGFFLTKNEHEQWKDIKDSKNSQKQLGFD